MIATLRSNSDEKKIFWTGLWKLKVPGKVRHFMWKACSDSLPTRQNVKKTHNFKGRCLSALPT